MKLNEFCWSTDEEIFSDDGHATREEALDEGRATWPDRTIYTGRKAPPRPIGIDAYDVTLLLEHKQEEADEDVGEVSDGWPGSTPAQDEDLRGRLDAVFQAWLDEHKLRPQWFRVVDVESHPCEAEQGR